VSGGDLDPGSLDVEHVVVVPARPGPLTRLDGLAGTRDEIDELLDDVFGAPDDGGAGPLDAVLLLGGAAAVIAGLTSLVPGWVLAAGAIAFVLGAVLPLRTFWRRAGDARRAARLRSAIGSGTVLRTDHPAVAELVAAHDRCVAAAAGSAAERRVQVAAVTHAAVAEVASLLAGRPVVLAAEVGYVQERTRALDAVTAALAAPADGGDAAERRTRVDARAEVERLAAGSAVRDAEELARSLRGPT
jgi:hypothetical protein